MITNFYNRGCYSLCRISFITILLSLLPGASCYVQASTFDNLLVHVVNPISDVKILPTTFPLPGTESTTLQISACRGEYEPTSFILRPLTTDITNLVLRISDLRKADATLPKESVDIRVVKVWYQGETAWKAIKQGSESILVPELLLKDDNLISVDPIQKKNFIKLRFPSHDKKVELEIGPGPRDRILHDNFEFPVRDSKEFMPLSLKKNENKQLWLTMKIPKSQKPGIYTGTIELLNQTTSLGTINLSVEVLPFKLEKPNLTYSIYYRGKLKSWANSLSSEYKSSKQLQAEYQNMYEHGISNPTIYQYINDTTGLTQVLEMRQNAGFNNKELYYLGFTGSMPTNESEYETLRTRIKKVQDISRAYGTQMVYFYGIDEAKDEKLFSQKNVWTFFHEMNARNFVAGRIGNFDKIGAGLDLLIAAYAPSKREAELYHGIGHRIFSYANPQIGAENPLIYRRNYGLILWQAGYDGAMNYAYQHSEGSVWNDLDGKYRDHMFTYPTTNGVIDTIAWEGFREGVDDVRYITTLENILEQPEVKDTTNAQKARQFLMTLKNEIPSELNDVRTEIIMHLRQLSSLNDDFDAPNPPSGISLN